MSVHTLPLGLLRALRSALWELTPLLGRQAATLALPALSVSLESSTPVVMVNTPLARRLAAHLALPDLSASMD